MALLTKFEICSALDSYTCTKKYIVWTKFGQMIEANDMSKINLLPILQHRRKCHLFFAGTETMNTCVSFITVYRLIIQITQVHVHTCSSRIVFITLLHI